MVSVAELGRVSIDYQPPNETVVNPSRVLGVGHTYQPPRAFLKLSSENPHDRVNIFPDVNEKIYQECYRQIFETPPFSDVQPFPLGTTFSIYGTLREWWKHHHPDSFEQVVKNIWKMPDKEYRILGDSWLHPILPLLSEENQDMLVKIGKQAFIKDFGFEPKGFWLPETAVSSITLKVLYKNGYEFVVLRDHQLQEQWQNPMFVRIVEGEEAIGEMAVFHCDSDLSGSISFPNEGKDITVNAEDFLHSFSHKNDLIWMSDTEFYGHHHPFKDQFLYTVTREDVLREAGFEAFDVKKALESNTRHYTHLRENSSWSCPHELGRWTGTCNCDSPSEGVLAYKQYLRDSLTELGIEVERQLDIIDPSWRDQFIKFFLATRKSMYVDGNLNADIQKLIQEEGMNILDDQEMQLFFKANLARLTGETSCVWFFPEDDRPERDIASVNIEEIRTLLARVKSPVPA